MIDKDKINNICYDTAKHFIEATGCADPLEHCIVCGYNHAYVCGTYRRFFRRYPVIKCLACGACYATLTKKHVR